MLSYPALGSYYPSFLIANLVSGEAISLYQTAEQKVEEIIQKGNERLLKNIKEHKLIKKLHLDKIDWQASFQESAQAAAKLLATVINKASKGTFQLLANLFLTFFAMYYFFRDGDKLIQRLKYLSPLADKYKEELFIRFISVSRATIKGTVVVGLIKGFIGGLTFWTFRYQFSDTVGGSYGDSFDYPYAGSLVSNVSGSSHYARDGTHLARNRPIFDFSAYHKQR